MNRPNGSEYACDRSGAHTPDGEGRYMPNGDRVCADCAGEGRNPDE